MTTYESKGCNKAAFVRDRPRCSKLIVNPLIPSSYKNSHPELKNVKTTSSTLFVHYLWHEVLLNQCSTVPKTTCRLLADEFAKRSAICHDCFWLFFKMTNNLYDFLKHLIQLYDIRTFKNISNKQNKRSDVNLICINVCHNILIRLDAHRYILKHKKMFTLYVRAWILINKANWNPKLTLNASILSKFVFKMFYSFMPVCNISHLEYLWRQQFHLFLFEFLKREAINCPSSIIVYCQSHVNSEYGGSLRSLGFASDCFILLHNVGLLSKWKDIKLLRKFHADANQCFDFMWSRLELYMKHQRLNNSQYRHVRQTFLSTFGRLKCLPNCELCLMVKSQPTIVRSKTVATLRMFRSLVLIENAKCGNNLCDSSLKLVLGRGERNGTLKKLRLCGGCKLLYYCDRKCQRMAWQNGHSKVCSRKYSVHVCSD